jgi:hypothetical protein
LLDSEATILVKPLLLAVICPGCKNARHQGWVVLAGLFKTVEESANIRVDMFDLITALRLTCIELLAPIVQELA